MGTKAIWHIMNIRILIRVRPLHHYHTYWKCIYTDASLSLDTFGLITYLQILVSPMTIERNIGNYMD